MSAMRTGLAVTVAGMLMMSSAHAQRLVPSVDIPQVSGSSNNSAVQLVQSSDQSFRINDMENTIRQLNGRVEELNFLLLQLQEKLRKMEQDNESRFQEIEEKQSGLTYNSTDVAKIDDQGDTSLGKLDPSEEKNSADGKTETTDKKESTKPVDTAETPAPQRGSLPRALGTLTFDNQGNVIDTKPSGPLQLNVPKSIFDDASTGVEAAQFGATPKEVYEAGFTAYENRNYPLSTTILKAMVTAWPKDPLVGKARYYLAESLFWQKKYYQAADLHLNTHRDFPEADTAADNLLGLGLALAGLNQREVACATYAEVLQQYPDSAPRLEKRIKDEQASTKC